MIKRIFLFFFLSIMIVSCAGKQNYNLPLNKNITNTKIVTISKDRVWKQLVQYLSSSFFVINNMDKESGFINLSFSGNPEKYIDCGTIYSYVKNAAGERTYNFPGSKEYKEYEVMLNGVKLLFFKRKLNLEGRINIIVQELSKNETLITVNTKYVVNQNTMVYNAARTRWRRFTGMISFNTKNKATFIDGEKVTCQSNGVLEREILDMIQ